MKATLLLMITLMMPETCSDLQMPVEKGRFRKPNLVEITASPSGIHLDLRYATANNFLGRPVYSMARAWLQRPAVAALKRVQKQLAKQGYGLIVYDAYRPWSVTKQFWDITPADKKHFVADPRRGSRHNRGCAVDVSLYDAKTGQPVSMPSDFDETTERAHVDYRGGSAHSRRHRDILRAAMEAHGFSVYVNEWWHFDYKDWAKYPLLDLSLDALVPSL
jgi:zinc D-Ala-D-Ala dipeptidase